MENNKCNKEVLELLMCYALQEDCDFYECKSLKKIYKKCINNLDKKEISKETKETLNNIDILLGLTPN